MLEKIVYRNHLGEEVHFGENGIFANENDLRNFAWSIVSRNDKITSFKKGISKKNLQCMIVNRDAGKCAELKNHIFEIMEKDVLAGKRGKMIVGDYYLQCYVTESKKKDFIQDRRYMIVDLVVQTDNPAWIKETTTTFSQQRTGSEGKDLDYNRDFPSDFSSILLGTTLINPGFVASNFRVIIFGPCESPRVTIAGHNYEIAVTIGSNEYVTIDSINKSIILTHEDGRTENCFNLRNRDSYIFEKIPVGVSSVSTSSDFKFDVVLLEERGEPKWT